MSRPDVQVDVADVREPRLASAGNLSWLEADVSNASSMARLLSEYDLGVCALPSRLGFPALEAAIEAGRNMVDVSSSTEDPLVLDKAARKAGVTLVPDCGLAPGISNLVAGRSVAERGMPRDLHVYVGGVAQDPNAPYGYVLTWSLDDLMEEYTRPARIVRDGHAVTVPVFSEHEEIDIDGVGRMEAFYSDGLRSLIHTITGARHMGEKTLRWPGHAAAVQPLVADGSLEKELTKHCATDDPQDLVVLVVDVHWAYKGERWTLVDRAREGRSAMARTTAFTTAATTRLAVERGLGEHGVRPLELVAQDAKAADFILDELGKRHVRLSRREHA